MSVDCFEIKPTLMPFCVSVYSKKDIKLLLIYFQREVNVSTLKIALKFETILLFCCFF